MTDKEQAAATYLNGSNGHGRLGVYGTYDDLAASDATTGLVSLAFIKEAIRRSALFCCVMTIIGFLVGCGIYVMFPAPYKASTSLLLTYGPYENGPGASSDNQAIAQTRTVAELAMHELGLRHNVDSFLAAYTVTVVSSQVLSITFTAPSASQAVRGANAVATQFLRFRAGKLEQDQELVFASLQQQVSQAKQNLSSIGTQISRVRAEPSSPAQASELSSLRAELSSVTATLANLQTAVSGNQTTVKPATTEAIKSSQVVDKAALLPRSRLRHLLLYPGAALVGGAAVGIAIVLIRAIVSDRLRRRDDVAGALGTPVRLSTGPLRPQGLLPARGRATADADIRRVAAHLGRAVPGHSGVLPALAVVAVDDPEAVALPLVSLATSCAQRGQRVVLADLASGAPAARLLGCGDGVSVADVQGTTVVIAVPEPDDVPPSGPLGHTLARERRSPFTDAVATECAQADLLLTLVALDPSFGGEHLPTWAADAVVVVTAGRSSWLKINAAGEMIRLSGTRLASAVLIGADSADESLGVVPAQPVSHDAEIVEQGAHPDGNGLSIAADR